MVLRADEFGILYHRSLAVVMLGCRYHCGSYDTLGSSILKICVIWFVLGLQCLGLGMSYVY